MPVQASPVLDAWLISIIPGRETSEFLLEESRSSSQKQKCPALSWNAAQPFHPLPCSHPPSQLPTFSPFNTHSFFHSSLKIWEIPCQRILFKWVSEKKKKKAIPYSRQTSSFFSPWGRRIIAEPGGKKNPNKLSPNPCCNQKNNCSKRFKPTAESLKWRNFSFSIESKQFLGHAAEIIYRLVRRKEKSSQM